MSKSIGNVVNPFETMETYGADAARYFLARVGGRFRHDIGASRPTTHRDAAFTMTLRLLPSSPAAMVDWTKTQFTKHSAELMSLVGNFYSRITAKKIEKLLLSSPTPTIVELRDAIKDGKQVQGSEILVQLGGLRQRVQGHMQNLIVADAIQEIVNVLVLVCLEQLPLRDSVADLSLFLHLQANKIYSETQPWLTSTDASHRAQLHVISAETLRICGILFQPFIPTKSVELLEALGTNPEERTWDHAEPGKGATGNFKQGIRLFADPALLLKE
jgi:methionyl-tRNA synthetase